LRYRYVLHYEVCQVRRGEETIDSKRKALLIAKVALDKKAEDVVVLDVRKVCNFTDFFIIASGTSSRRIKAIVAWIEEELAKKRIKANHIEGKANALWALLDYNNVIAHIFSQPVREFYSLEQLWGDAPKVKI